jgi:hypothetical protein
MAPGVNVTMDSHASIEGLVASEWGSPLRLSVAPDPKPHNGRERGCPPDREQKQVHVGKGDSQVFEGPTNHESTRDSEEDVSPGPESVGPRDLATGPTS